MSSEWIVKIASENWKGFLNGAEMTLYISLIGTVIGSIIGMLIGVIRTIPKGDRGAKKILLTVINAILKTLCAAIICCLFTIPFFIDYVNIFF